MKKRNVKAFTVVELVIVIAVIAVLAAVMIPTFSGLIKRANISADEAELTSLNSQLAIRDIESEADLYAAIVDTYGEDAADNFAPRSAKYGYNYWYDTATNTVILETVSDLEDGSGSVKANYNNGGVAFLSVVPLAAEEPENVFYNANKDSYRMYFERYFLLDTVGAVADAIDTITEAVISGNTEMIAEAITALRETSKYFEDMADALSERLGVLAKLESFEVTADKGLTAGDIIYVPYDVKEFTLTAGNFVSDNGGALGDSITVTWTSSNDLATVDASGKVTLALPAVGADSEVTITATATAGESEPNSVEKNVCIVRINAVTLEAEFGSIELDTAGDVLTSTITYDGTKDSYSMGSISAYAYNYTIEGIELDDTITFETEGNIFTIESNNLVLTKEEFGTQNLTIKVGQYITDTVAIEVVDNSSSPFEVNSITEDIKMGATYLFRVGNGNSFTLNKLFSTEKAPDDITLKIYDASLTYGEGERVEIATTGSGFRATYTSGLTKDNWESSAIQFGGTGVAIIEINTEKGTATLAVEVVNGKNVTSASDFSGATNYVVLNDIVWGSATNVAISGTIYGNGFAINASTYSPTIEDNRNYAMFTLSGGTIDNLVINGPVYPELVYSGKTYYVAGIYATGDATITNSCISGFREPIMANGTSLYLENTTLVGGNYANLWLQAGSLTLNNVTTVQESTTATIGSGSVLGAGIIANSGINASNVTIVGDLTQYNWVSKDQASTYMHDDVSSLIDTLYSNTTITHTVDGTKYINTGIVFQGTNGTVNNAAQTSGHGYTTETVSGELMDVEFTGKIYTRTTTAGTISSIPTYSGYAPSTQAVLKPIFEDNLSKTNGQVVYSIDIPNGATATLDTSVYTASKYSGQTVTVNISCSGDGVTVSGNEITFSKVGTFTVTYTVTDNWFFNADGSKQTANNEDTYTVTVAVANSNHPNAVINGATSAKTTDWVKTGSYGDYNYQAWFELLSGVTITDYNADGTSFTVTPTATDLQGLTITVVSGTQYTEITGISTSDGYWMYDVKDNDGNTTAYSVVFKYSYTGQNNFPVTATYTATLAAGEECCGKIPAVNGCDVCKPDSCVTPDTLVTLADGTQKRVDQLTYSDKLLAWNMFDGEYQETYASYIISHGDDVYRIIDLEFSDGTHVRIQGEHGFLDANTGKWVFIDEYNAASYIGHEFVRQVGDNYESVKLADYSVYEEYTGSYSVASAGCLNIITNGVLSITPVYGFEDSERFYNFFEMGENLTYDTEALQADIEKYGLFVYEELAEYMTVEEFNFFKECNGCYWKIAVEKGIMTIDELIGALSSPDLVQ